MRRLQGIKNSWKLSLIIISLVSCAHPKNSVYQAELFTDKTPLNIAAKSTAQLFKRLTLTSKKEELIGGIFGRKGHMSWNIINYRDTTIRFNPNLKNLVEDYQSDETPLSDFYTIYYLNPKNRIPCRYAGPFQYRQPGFCILCATKRLKSLPG